jgi:steroid 5-alpha reductase family enzyme
LAGCLNFAVIAVGSYALGVLRNGGLFTTFRALLMTVLVLLWSLRLAIFLELRILARRRDAPLEHLRDNLHKYGSVWAVQALWVWLVSLPGLLVNTTVSREDYALLSGKCTPFGLGLWIFGFAIEWYADHSKSAFNALHRQQSRRRSSRTADDAHDGMTAVVANVLSATSAAVPSSSPARSILGESPHSTSRRSSNANQQSPSAGSGPRRPFKKDGLWYWSRHPNYFGECALWFGTWLIALASPMAPFLKLLSLASPTLTCVLLIFVSGIPVAEKRDDRRYGQDPEYMRWKFCTSPLFPCLPWVYARLPRCIKLYVFLDGYRPDVRRVRRTLLTLNRLWNRLRETAGT